MSPLSLTARRPVAYVPEHPYPPLKRVEYHPAGDFFSRFTRNGVGSAGHSKNSGWLERLLPLAVPQRNASDQGSWWRPQMYQIRQLVEAQAMSDDDFARTLLALFNTDAFTPPVKDRCMADAIAMYCHLTPHSFWVVTALVCESLLQECPDYHNAWTRFPCTLVSLKKCLAIMQEDSSVVLSAIDQKRLIQLSIIVDLQCQQLLTSIIEIVSSEITPQRTSGRLGQDLTANPLPGTEIVPSQIRPRNALFVDPQRTRARLGQDLTAGSSLGRQVIDSTSSLAARALERDASETRSENGCTEALGALAAVTVLFFALHVICTQITSKFGH